MQIIIITGLPGSGKSHLIEDFYHQYGDDAAYLRDPRSKNDIDTAFEQAKQKQRLIVDSYTLCSKWGREQFFKLAAQHLPEAQIKWYFFENNVDQAILNAAARPNKSVLPTILLSAQDYSLPEGDVTILPVYTPLIENNITTQLSVD